MNGGCLRIFQNSNPIDVAGMALLPMAFLDTSPYFHQFPMGNQFRNRQRAQVQTESPHAWAENEDNKGYLDNYFDCMKRYSCNCLVGFVSTSFKYNIKRGYWITKALTSLLEATCDWVCSHFIGFSSWISSFWVFVCFFGNFYHK